VYSGTPQSTIIIIQGVSLITRMVFSVSAHQNVRILLVGERNVGKTSIVLSLVSEEFTEDVPAKAEEITIPGDVTPDKVPTFIVDYSAAEQTVEMLTLEIQRAHKNVPDGVINDAITQRGFLFLHCLYIQRGRNETTWRVLRKFGYMNNLEMSKEYLRPFIRVPIGCTSELSHKGQQFLSTLFERYDKDKDGALSPAEVDSLFSTCPSPLWGPDVHCTVPTNSQGWITLQGFMSQWVLITLFNLPRALEYLAYLGYPISETENQLSAIQVTREKKLDLAKKQSTRNVYQCHVIGPSGSGKSMFCRSFIGDNLEDIQLSELEGRPQCTVNAVQVYGQEKYLVLRDIDVRNISEPLQPSEVQCDVACLVYDVSNPKSFEYTARIYLKYFVDSKIPVLIVANKCDLEETRQDYILQPAAFCRQHKLPSPHPFTASGRIERDTYVKLSTMAAFPHLQQLGLLIGDSAVWWKAGLGIAAVTALGFLVVRVLVTDRR